uniref:Uncharacterized protein n=1 Tax=Anguilla anguilla TaxID=7936 RepID=A0A0E9S3R6_ANGAN
MTLISVLCKAFCGPSARFLPCTQGAQHAL